jgi:hypothetical protein
MAERRSARQGGSPEANMLMSFLTCCYSNSRFTPIVIEMICESLLPDRRRQAGAQSPFIYLPEKATRAIHDSAIAFYERLLTAFCQESFDPKMSAFAALNAYFFPTMGAISPFALSEGRELHDKE